MAVPPAVLHAHLLAAISVLHQQGHRVMAAELRDAVMDGYRLRPDGPRGWTEVGTSVGLTRA